MNPTYLIWLTLFCVVLYMMNEDSNVGEFINLFFQGVSIQLKKYYYMAKLHPFWITNPIGRWWMMRKYRKMADEMLQSIKEKTTEDK